MFYYNILPTRNIGVNLSILTYSSELELSVGQIALIEIKTTEDYGLVISQNAYIEATFGDNPELKSKIKPIISIFPYQLSGQQLLFVKTFADNTFCSLNDIWNSIWKNFELLTKKQLAELESQKTLQIELNSINHTNSDSDSYNQQLPYKTPLISNSNQNSSSNYFNTNKSSQNIEFELNSNYTLRIIYIIRNVMSSIANTQEPLIDQQNGQLLILFPEAKFLTRIQKEFQIELSNHPEILNSIEIFCFSAKPTKPTKSTFWNMVSNYNLQTPNFDETLASKTKSKKSFGNIEGNIKNNSSKLQIIFGTRSAIFLPIPRLLHIILIDEGNSMYIQDQNSLYYDTRDAVFLMYKAFLSSLTMISRLPSVRLHSFYPEKVLEYQNTYMSVTDKNLPNIKISHFDKKSANFELFGWEIEQILRKDEDRE